MRCRSIVVLALVLSAAVASADIYRYRDPAGRLVISDSPPPAGVVPTSSYRQTVRPVEPEAEPEPAAEAPSAPAPQVVVVPVQAPEPTPVPKPESEPVDTRQFGLLKQGMSQGEVKRRLGEPEDRTDHGVQLVSWLEGMHVVRRTVHKETWYYPGTSRVWPVRLVFGDGLLLEKVKERP